MGSNWSKTLIFKMLITVACIQATVISFGQTDSQKQMMYEHINRDSRGSSLMTKIEPIENKEALFSKAQVLPVYQVVFDKLKKPKLIQKEKYYLVFYIGRLYIFINNKSSRLFENSTVIQNISKLNFENKKFEIVYFNESFSFNGEFLNPLITDKNFSFIIEKENKYSSISEYIASKYGSFEKYEEKLNLDKIRGKLNSNDAVNIVKNNYKNYQYNCPKDTTLILRKLIDFVNQATGGISINQENKLLEKIKIKINPIKYITDITNKGKIKDSLYNNDIKKAIKENDDANKKVIKIEGNYDFNIYNANIINELLDILTNQQFVNYKNFVDVLFPICETNNVFKTERYFISKDLLIEKKFFNAKNLNEENIAFNKYSQKILTDCGCVFDQTIKQ